MQVVGANKGGVVAVVEGLRGFVPFSQISTVIPVTWLTTFNYLFKLLFEYVHM